MLIDPGDVAICVGEEAAPAGYACQPTSPPIVQTSLFFFPTYQALLEGLAAQDRHQVYTRGRNPTVSALERKLAVLERGEACQCFASGMAAISAVLLGLLRAGDHIVFVNQVYGPTLQLAAQLERFGIEHDVALDTDVAAVRRAMRPATRLLWLESPGTMLFRLADLSALAELAREHGALSCIDNSWATPLLQKPLQHGVDIVVHSCTKYLGGHSDVIAGAVVSTAERVEELFYCAFLLNGGVLGPFDAWLLLRGLRTLPARLRQHGEDGLRIAEFLAAHAAVRRVHHPALTGDAGLVARQLGGYSGLFSFELERGDFESVASVLNGLRQVRLGVSWGGVESIAISPNRGDNATALEAQGIPPGLIRLSVGLEGAETLIRDLDSALGSVA